MSLDQEVYLRGELKKAERERDDARVALREANAINEGLDRKQRALEARVKELKERGWELVKAQGRMLEHWAESDDAGKRDLWQELHRCGDDLRAILREKP